MSAALGLLRRRVLSTPRALLVGAAHGHARGELRALTRFRSFSTVHDSASTSTNSVDTEPATTAKELKKHYREPSLRVRIVPMFTDNYGYVVIDEANQTMFTVDPAEPSKILAVLKEEEEAKSREFMGILTTHKHADHTAGNVEIAEKYPNAHVYGPGSEEIPACTKPLKGGEKFMIGGVKVKALSVPCHTSGHLAYVVSGDPQTPPLLFPGDTLFVGGCGRFFEGTAEDMYRALYEVILTLPKDTRVYCGHEYTMANLRFALSVDPSNAVLRDKIAQVKIRRSKNLPSVPSTLREEMQYNPFLRVHNEIIRNAVGGTDPVSVLDNLRRRKDSFE